MASVWSLLGWKSSLASGLAQLEERWNSFIIFYDHITLHVVAGPRSWSYLLPFFLVFTTLLISPSILPRRSILWLILPIIYSIQAYVWIAHRSFDVISMNNALAAFMLLGWYNVRKDFKYIIRQKDGKQKLEGYPSRLVERFKWVLTLFFSLQLKDFLIGSHTHDQKQLRSTPRQFEPFLRQTIKETAFTYILLDITSNWIRKVAQTPYWIASAASSLAGDDAMSKSFQSLVLMAHVYASLALYNAFLPTLLLFLPIIAVPSFRDSTLLSPLALSRHFGPISSIWRPTASRPTWGIRAFWGTFWHQNMRYFTSTPGLALAHLCGISSRNPAKYMLATASAFFFSGVVHAGIVPPEPLGTEWTVSQLRIGVAAFFWLQIAGIAIETIIASALLQQHKKATGSDGSSGKESKAQQTNVPSVRVQLAIAAWTSVFLTGSAYCTVLPVGKELGWWTLPAVPVSVVAWWEGRPQWWQT